MRNIVLAAAGWAIVTVTIADVFRTVLWSSRGGGPVTAGITAAYRRISELFAGHGNVRAAVGPIAIATTILTWTVGLLGGFALTTQIDPDALRSSSTNVPADWIERIYVVGYTMFTMGNGDFAPTTDGMRMLIVLINGTGMLLVTLSVTYLVPVIGASVASRSFAGGVLSLGDDPAEVVARAWDGRRVQLDSQLQKAHTELGALAQQHLAYPVLHLFDSPDPSLSAPRAVRCVDEVLTLLNAVDQEVAPPAPVRRQLRSSVARYTRTYGTRGHTSAEAPAAPDLEPLRAAGVPLRLDERAFEALVEDLDEHRGWVQSIASRAGPREQ